MCERCNIAAEIKATRKRGAETKVTSPLFKQQEHGLTRSERVSGWVNKRPPPLLPFSGAAAMGAVGTVAVVEGEGEGWG